ncbi:MAG: MaoC/PaaZ C-terminal domain-containing protein [Bacillota bacterium]
MKHLWDYRVNDPLPVREWRPDILQFRQFAEVSGNFNPVHLDDAYARRAGLEGAVAQGVLTMAQLGAMLTDWMGEEGTLKSLEVRFEKMVRAGERILCSGYIKDTSLNALICEIMVVNDRAEKVLSGSAVVTFNTPEN